MDQNDDDAQHHGSLGISMREDDGRVIVIAVMPGSPAAKAGLRVGDQIRFVGDQRIATAQGLADEVAEYRPGSRVDLAIRRNGEKQTVSVTLGSRQSWAGQQDRFNQNARNANPPLDRQANRQLQDGNRRLYSYNNGRQQNEHSQQQLADRVSTLQQQLSQLQQELNSVRAQLNQGAEFRPGGQSRPGCADDGTVGLAQCRLTHGVQVRPSENAARRLCVANDEDPEHPGRQFAAGRGVRFICAKREVGCGRTGPLHAGQCVPPCVTLYAHEKRPGRRSPGP